MSDATMTSPEGGLRLSTAGTTILDKVVNVASLHLYDLPSKQYVTTGPAVFDCEQVAVSLLRINSGLGLNPGAELVQGGPGCDFGWSIVAELAIVRCAPKPSPKGVVPLDRLKAGTEKSSQDTFILLETIEALAEEIYGGFNASLIPFGSEGAFVSTSATITMVLP